MHGGIGPHSVFLSPKAHSVALLGGWWYATPIGAKLAALPERALRVLPPVVADSKIAAGAIDLELIRLTGREMLADPSGVKLLREARVPKPFATWLNHPPAANAFADYQSWEAARDAGFGPRRFVELGIDPDAVYPPS